MKPSPFLTASMCVYHLGFVKGSEMHCELLAALDDTQPSAIFKHDTCHMTVIVVSLMTASRYRGGPHDGA